MVSGAIVFNQRWSEITGYPLDELDKALDATRERPGNFLKALVTP